MCDGESNTMFCVCGANAMNMLFMHLMRFISFCDLVEVSNFPTMLLAVRELWKRLEL